MLQITKQKLRVALIHYWLVGMRGGERVLERIARLYPQADIFAHVVNPAAISGELRDRRIRTTFIARLPAAARRYQSYLPLMPLALEQLDLRGYDLVISSESGPAKGAIAAPDALHICYCHSPMRYLWDQYPAYRERAGFVRRSSMPLLCHYLRNWDMASASRVDSFIANSNFIRHRIRRAWGRNSSVVHPPVPVELYQSSETVGEYYLWVGQLISYKRPDLAVDAFNRLGLPLLVIGDGDMAAELKGRAGPNIRFVDRMPFDRLRQAYAEAMALVFTAEEDFGIVPVEANAAGRPVIAYGRGGILDSIVEQTTGIFFGEQSIEALVDAVERFETWLPEFDPAAAIENAQRFSPERFDSKFLEAVDHARVEKA
jgi:glycosyltransferase involved in cell wall biosynthesis